MNVLIAHNFYQQAGGEDQTFADEAKMLESHGSKVSRFTMDNDEVEAIGKFAAARKALWNRDAQKKLKQAIRESGAEVVHFHNTFPLISPAAYYAAHEAGAAVVQTLHNYRLLCVTATFCRDDRVCEDCLGRLIAWPGVLHKCYRGSRAGSAVVAAMQTFHRLMGTWQREVDVFITLSEFGRKKFIQGGLPADRLMIKPIYSDPDPGVGKGSGNFAVFVGRLTGEKGIPFLLQAWPRVFAETGMTVKIIGGGPLKAECDEAGKRGQGIEFLGRLESFKDVYDTMGEAQALIFPSVWYEGQPRTIVESLAKGTPVLSSRLGSMPEMVAEGKTGTLFEAGNVEDFVQKASIFLSNKTNRSPMRMAARQEFEDRYTVERNYPLLMACYERALQIRTGNK